MLFSWIRFLRSRDRGPANRRPQQADDWPILPQLVTAADGNDRSEVPASATGTPKGGSEGSLFLPSVQKQGSLNPGERRQRAGNGWLPAPPRSVQPHRSQSGDRKPPKLPPRVLAMPNDDPSWGAWIAYCETMRERRENAARLRTITASK